MLRADTCAGDEQVGAIDIAPGKIHIGSANMASLAALKSETGNGTQIWGLWPSVVIALVVALPMLLPPVLPLADLGGHVGRYAIQLDAGRDSVLAQWYSFGWLLIPNLGADLLVEFLGPLAGLEPAVRMIVFLAAFLQAFGILAVSRAAHGRITPFAVLALPFVYAHSMLYGFLNYTLALGLLWCSVALWIAMSGDGPTRRRWVVFALIATVMWTCHLVGWALLCIAAGSQEFVGQYERRKALVPAALASVVPLSCLLVPWLIRLLTFQPSTGTGKSSGFFIMSEKFAELFQVFRDRWYMFDLASIEFVLAVIVWSWFTSRTRINRGLMLAALITTVCVIVVPHRLIGSFFADQRLIEPALLFALLAIGLSGRGGARLPHILFGAAVLFAGARLAGSAISLLQLGNRSAQDLAVLDALPRHAQMVTFRARPCPPPIEWTIDRWTHLSGYAVARRHAFSNDQWELPGGQLLTVHNPAAGAFQADDSQIVYETACLGRGGVAAKVAKVPAAIPYLWVIWSSDPKAFDQWQPIARRGRSVLYRRDATLTGRE
jgi:hypothetical protein